jgi:hypothetical protein
MFLATLGFFLYLYCITNLVYFLCRIKGLVYLELSSFFKKFYIVVVLIKSNADIVLETSESTF